MTSGVAGGVPRGVPRGVTSADSVVFTLIDLAERGVDWLAGYNEVDEAVLLLRELATVAHFETDFEIAISGLRLNMEKSMSSKVGRGVFGIINFLLICIM